MTRITIILFLIAAMIFTPGRVWAAAKVTPTAVVTPTPEVTPTPAQEQNITVPTKERGKLEQLVEDQILGKVSATNFMRWGIKNAVESGIPVNTVVLVLLFPLVTTIIAASRHILGLRGFGIFTPAVTAVAFLATGLSLGISLFLATLAVAMIGRLLMRRMRLQYLPRMSLLIWFICLGILGILFLAPGVGSLGISGAVDLAKKVGIFPILLMILLTETFISTQISHGGKVAVQMTAETLVLASVSYSIMNMEMAQSWVLVHPEVTILVLALVNIGLGKFTGLRILEMWRFRDLLRK